MSIIRINSTFAMIHIHYDIFSFPIILDNVKQEEVPAVDLELANVVCLVGDAVL